MSEIKNTLEQTEKSNEIPVTQTDIPKAFDSSNISENSVAESKQFFDDIFKTLGLISVTETKSELSENGASGEADYSNCLEETEDGKYRDKVTGKGYDSMDEWKADQETAAKRYHGVADYFEEKAKQEWAKFNNSDENGESEKDRWEYYRNSQEYYAKAKECRETGDKIMTKILGESETANNALKRDITLFDSVIHFFSGILGNEANKGHNIHETDGMFTNGDLSERFSKFEGKKFSELNQQEVKEIVDIAVDNLQEKYGNVIPAERFEKIRDSIYFVDNETIANDCNTSSEIARNICGYYSGDSDTIKVNKDCSDSLGNILATIDHEAMHMATQKFDGSYITGVKTDTPLVYGRNVGMNEGLTEMYSIRNIQELYPDYHSNSYVSNVEIMEKFEEVYGEDKLKDAYLSNNFDGIKNEYDQVMGQGEFYNFCNIMDAMHEDYSAGRTFIADIRKGMLLQMIEKFNVAKKGE